MNVVITEAGRNIALISLGIVSLSTTVRYFTIDREKVKEGQKRIKEHQKKLKEAQKAGDSNKMKKHQQDMMAETMESFKHNMKPMVFTLIPLLLIFGWMRGTYGEYGVASEVQLIEYHPQDLEILSISSSGKIFRDESFVLWSLGNISGGKSGALTVSAKGRPPDELLKSNSFKLTYLGSDNQTHEFSGNEIIDEESILTVKRQDFVQSGNEVSYKIKYENKKFIVQLGSYKLGWFGWYIIISIASSTILNKFLKIT
ncbi:MAG: EMC3/TMCO1 family protein [Methanobacteriota archaeon]